MKLIGLMVGDEHDERLDALAKQLGWSRSQLIRQLIAHAVVESTPSIRVALPEGMGPEVGEDVA
jgi:predicted DNA-binding protein